MVIPLADRKTAQLEPVGLYVNPKDGLMGTDFQMCSVQVFRCADRRLPVVSAVGQNGCPGLPKP